MDPNTTALMLPDSPAQHGPLLSRRGLGRLAAGAATALRARRATGAASAASAPGAAPAVRPPHGVEVAAYYFPNYHRDWRNDLWYGAGWTEWELVHAAQPRFPGHRQPLEPAWGAFDEADPAWARRQIDLAAGHGITAFLFDWYWYDGAPYLQGALERGFLPASGRPRSPGGAPGGGGTPAAPLKFALMWANHDWLDIQPASATEAPPVLARGGVSAAQFDRLTDYVAERYFTQPHYLTLDGQPYFSLYELTTFVDGIGGTGEARRALARFRDKARALGYTGLHLNGITWGAAPARAGAAQAPLPETVALAMELGLDSVGSYTWFHHFAPGATEDRFPRAPYRLALDSYGAWCERCAAFPLDYHPNATMGWDPSPRTAPGEAYEPRGYPWTAILDGNTPEEFRDGLRRARAFAGRPLPSGREQRLVTINAWNEWTEGSYLLPDSAHGTAYLEAVRDVFPPA
jgi:hypothetical protein